MNRRDQIIERLKEAYPDACCELVHKDAYELLVATILSAQSTDKRVNLVTGELFRTYNTPTKIVALGEAALAEKIKSIGFYNTKAKNIIAMSKLILEEHDGEVPTTMEELIQLPGVGRKTANVVLSNAFGVPAFAVDTHVFRLAHRLGFSKGKTPDEVEQDLMKKIPRKEWIDMHHLLIFHGRRTCKAQRPLCPSCSLLDLCKFKGKVL